MPVKHALLALLTERDLTGYELKLRFERILGEFWQLNSGQVYSTLERLRREGMVSRSRVHDDGDGDAARAAFAIRPRGRQALARWMAAPVGRLRPVRDPLFVKLVFCDPGDVARVLRSFAAEARRYHEATETLRALVARAPMSHGGRVRWLVADAARRSYQAQLEWLESVRRFLGESDPPTTRREPLPLRRAPARHGDGREAVA
ncbi:MAG: PadR family transcriptional regulator [Deltaproteobacteria bacterium]|nr:PadR family transcriptional regulator [Deltaproteobacteria bacterium]